MSGLDFRKFPALFTFLPLAAGILLSYNFDLGISYLHGLYFLVFLVLIAILSIFIYTKIKQALSYQYLVYFIFALIFGTASMQYYYYKIDDNSILRNAGHFKYSNVILYGTISDDPDIKDDRLRLMIDTDSLSQGTNSFQIKGTVLATVYKNHFSREKADSLNVGDKIQLNGKLETLPHRRNPGEFDYGEYLKLHGIEAVITSTGFENLKKTGEAESGFFRTKVISPVKAYINRIIDLYSTGDQREFLRGLLLGDKSNISKETKENFINAGVAHIIAVSGLNVVYVLIVLNGLLLLFPIPKIYKNVILMLSLLFYMELTGNSPSIVRATIMAIIFLLAQFFERKPNSYNTLAFAALVILIIDPRQLFDSGFILSFSAILSIVYFNPRLEKLVSKINWYNNLNTEKKLNKYFKEAVILFLGTFAAQLGTLPVTAIMFKKISVVSLIANLFAIPISNISLALGFVSVFVSLISGWAASVFAAANNFIMYYLLKAIAISANFDFSYIETYRLDFLLFIMYYAVILLLFALNKQNYRARLVIVLFLILNFFVFKSVLSYSNNAKISYLDVGNSNCTLISMPEGTNILINAGTSSANYTSAERNLIPYLKIEGVNKIDLLVITAIDANEFRNLKYLVNNFNVKKIIIPGYYKDLFDYAAIRKAFYGQGIEFVDSSRIVNQKGKFRIYLYYDHELKGASIMAKFVYGDESFLFTDSEEPADINDNYGFAGNESKLTALRVPLYGSFDFTPADFVIKTNPACVIISQKNRNKIIESENFEETLGKMGFKVLNVADRGAVIMETDGERTKVVNWK
jgi:competence protein ComEC